MGGGLSLSSKRTVGGGCYETDSSFGKGIKRFAKCAEKLVHRGVQVSSGDLLSFIKRRKLMGA